jgi:hypothetical protein
MPSGWNLPFTADPYGVDYEYRVTITGAPRSATYLCGDVSWSGSLLVLTRTASAVGSPNERPIGRLVIPLQWPATAAIDYIGDGK